MYIQKETLNTKSENTRMLNCTKTVLSQLPPPPYHYFKCPWQEDMCYTPSRQPSGSPISNSPRELRSPLKGSCSVEKSRAQIFIHVPDCYWSSRFTEQLMFRYKHPTLPCVWAAALSKNVICSDRTVYSRKVWCIGVTVTVWASETVVSKPYWQEAYDYDAE